MIHVTESIHAVILAGGTGARMGSGTPKQFLDLEGEPIIVKALRQFTAIPAIRGIVITSPRELIDQTWKVVEANDVPKIVAIVEGGDTRQGSSYRGLMAIPHADEDIIVFHDAVRPFIRVKTILACVEAAAASGAAGVYVSAIDTITEIRNGRVHRTLPRADLFYTQTPQAFRYGIIRRAHERALETGSVATDDVALVRAMDVPVTAVEGDYQNIKITTPADLAIARVIVSPAASRD